MGGARSDRAQGFIHAALALLLAAALVLTSLFAVHPSAYAMAPAEEPSAEQAVLTEAGDGEGLTTVADVPEAGSNTSNPIKPRPKVEITTGVVAIEPPDASIEEESTPLGAFDFDTCVFHVVMLIGIGLTVVYTLFALHRTRKQVTNLGRFSAALTGDVVRSADLTPGASSPASAPVAPAASAEN